MLNYLSARAVHFLSRSFVPRGRKKMLRRIEIGMVAHVGNSPHGVTKEFAVRLIIVQQNGKQLNCSEKKIRKPTS